MLTDSRIAPSRAGLHSLVFAVVAVLFLSSGAEAAKARTAQDENFDISGIRTYDFFMHESRTEAGPYAPIIFPRLRSLIVESLTEKGFEKVSESPDFLVTFDNQIADTLGVAGVREEIGKHAVWEGFDPGGGGGGGASQGVLVIRMHEAGEEEPFWAGADDMDIAGRLDTEKIWKKARKAAKRILAQFPER